MRLFSSRRLSGKNKKKPFLRRVLRFVRWLPQVLLLVATVDIYYLVHIWPNWESLSAGPPPRSNFIDAYALQRQRDGSLPPLQWRPVSIQEIPAAVQEAVVTAEDSRFHTHSGFDLIAFQEAMRYNLARGRVVYGASTISQQTVKNLFLSGSRDPLRKWHEIVLTIGMEFNLSKGRILELYLNIAEFGLGIYGVGAAANHYWNIPAAQLTFTQAIELAATLPSPRDHNPATRTPDFLARVRKIRRHLGLAPTSHTYKPN